MYLSLYRRHRPQVFAEVVAQEAAVDLLSRQIGKGRNSHAYLFSGPRGCGKTTLARIAAKALNCSARGEDGEPCDKCSSCLAIASGSSLDVVEIDGASNRRIEDIRELLEHISLSPFFGKFKIYIIDEVHMLTNEAFNALLKTLEEPPEALVFILATTEPHKVPATIRSRCQHIPFHRIPVGAIVGCLESVSAAEGASLTRDALWEIARESDGSLRDALSLLEQALSAGLPSVTLEDIRGILGGGGRSDLEKLLPSLREGSAEALAMLESMLERGLNAERLVEGMFMIFRDLLVAARWKDEGVRSLPLSDDEKNFIKEESGKWKESELWRILEFCTRTLPRARFGLKSEIAFGMLLGLFSPAKEDTTGERASCPKPVETGEAVKAPIPDRTRSPEPGSEVSRPSTAPGDECKSLWEDCVEAMSADNLPLHCACILSRAERDGDVVSIVFPEDFRFSFETAVSPRNLACLDAIGKQHFPGAQMKLVCGTRSVYAAPAQAPDQESTEATVSGSATSGALAVPAAPEKRRKKEPEKIAAEEAVQDKNGSFAEVQRCFNADLLMLKEENMDETDIPEGAAADQ